MAPSQDTNSLCSERLDLGKCPVILVDHAPQVHPGGQSGYQTLHAAGIMLDVICISSAEKERHGILGLENLVVALGVEFRIAGLFNVIGIIPTRSTRPRQSVPRMHAIDQRRFSGAIRPGKNDQTRGYRNVRNRCMRESLEVPKLNLANFHRSQQYAARSKKRAAL